MQEGGLRLNGFRVGINGAGERITGCAGLAAGEENKDGKVDLIVGNQFGIVNMLLAKGNGAAVLNTASVLRRRFVRFHLAVYS